jgi:hypothetical protein
MINFSSEIKEKLAGEWLPSIYEKKVRALRTRAHKQLISQRENRASIQHTLLGIELKVGSRRIACPDLSTARYLQVFARIGCREVAVPYDITKISTLADELESAWQKALLLWRAATRKKSPQVKGKLRANLIKTMRNEIKDIGAGALMPEFNQNTKQRKN